MAARSRRDRNLSFPNRTSLRPRVRMIPLWCVCTTECDQTHRPGTGPLDMNLDLVSDVFEGDGSEIVPRSEPEFSEQDVVEAPCSDEPVVVRFYDGVRPDTSPGTGPLDVNLDLVSDVSEG